MAEHEQWTSVGLWCGVLKLLSNIHGDRSIAMDGDPKSVAFMNRLNVLADIEQAYLALPVMEKKPQGTPAETSELNYLTDESSN